MTSLWEEVWDETREAASSDGMRGEAEALVLLVFELRPAVE